MIYFDAHCDTITEIMEKEENLYSNSCHIDIKRSKDLPYKHVQFFAAFISPSAGHAYAMKRAVQIIDKLMEQIQIYDNDMMLCCNYSQILEALENNKIAALLSIEGGEALQGDLAALRTFYRLGVRSICLTWNYRNEIADGVGDASSQGGLTPFGKEVVKEMNSLGMIIDVSHLSEKGFWDVVSESNQPFIASHSNAKAICSHKRNLTDQQLKAIAEKGGVVGINFYPPFLSDSGDADINDIIRHIEHMAGIIGCDHIGIGADFDGIEKTPRGISGIKDVEEVFNQLAKLNYKEEDIYKIAGENFMELMKKILK